MRADRADEPDVATVQDYTWRRGVVVALWVYALAILVADIAAGLPMGSIIATLVFVGLGAATVLSGLGLSADEHAHRPALGESDFIARWIVYALPLRVEVARVWWVLLGCVFLAAGGYVWSVNRPVPTPEPGRYTATFSPREPSFDFSFVVSGHKVRDAVLTWQALCASGAVVGGTVEPGDTPTSGWTSAADYELDTANGGIAHVHTVSDTGRFSNAQTAAGVLNLSVTVKQNGQTVDRCTTGALHWIAHRQDAAVVSPGG